MHLTRKAALMVGVTLGTLSPAMAQQSELPDFMERMGGFSYEGQVSGMDAYTKDGYNGLIMVAPDGRTAIAGNVFSARGRDIGSVFSGADPITIFETSGPPVAEVTEDTPANGKASDVAAGPLSPDEITTMERGVGRIEEQVMSGSGETQASDQALKPVVPEAPASSGETRGPVDSAAITRDTEAALDGLGEEDKRILMRALVELLSDVENEQEFQSAVEVWTGETVRRYRAALEDGDATDARAAISGSPGVTTGDAAGEVAGPAGEVNEASGAGGEDAVTPEERAGAKSVDHTSAKNITKLVEAPEATVTDQLLADIRHDALWFGLGAMDAPVAYAFIDPACPYCARAISQLTPLVETGDLQLRIALVPVISEKSPGFIASIFAAEEPPIAFLKHELDWTQGRTDLAGAEYQDLNEVLRRGVSANVEMMTSYEIPGVPFFVFDTEDGARVINGVPETGDFEAAMPDPYSGDQ